MESSHSDIPDAWCPLIPSKHIRKLYATVNELRRINDVYDDWRATMSRHSETKNVGIILDRIRILMINVGVACGSNRDLAEQVQTLVSAQLRETALHIASILSEKTNDDKTLKLSLKEFFSNIRFVRDIDPTEEIRNAIRNAQRVSTDPILEKILKNIYPEWTGEQRENIDKTASVTKAALDKVAVILYYIYKRLLTPDPWGNARDVQV